MRKTILVVDDEEIIVEYTVAVLEGAGRYDVLGALHADEALERVVRTPLDLMISDIRMPGMDGFDLVRAVRRVCPAVQVVFMTGFDVPEARVEASGLGSLAFLQKPFQADRLLEIVEEAFQLEHEARSLPLRPAGPDGRGQRQGISLQGRLEQFPLGEILQMCCMARRTGRIVLIRGGDRGEIYVRDGCIVHAVHADRTGEEAFYELYDWDHGALAMEDAVTSDEATVQGGWEHLLMEAARRRDESIFTVA